MKYLSLKSVSSAYDGCYKKTTNQFWSLIAILKVINQRIEPATSYTFISKDVSVFLDNLFTFGKRNNYDSITWSILFSNIWKDYMLSNFIRNSPNIYDVAIWFYRKGKFEDDIDTAKLLSAFLNTIHLKKEDIISYFDFDEKEVIFEDNPYDDESLREELSTNHEVIFQSEVLDEQGSVVQYEKQTLIFDDKKCIQYAAGNFGQAYVQTLYSAQKVQQCLILTKFDFNSLYKKQLNQSDNIMVNNQIIYYGAPGTGKSFRVNADTKGEAVVRTTFHPDSDYSTFVGAYKPTMKPVADKYKAVAGKDEEITYEFISQAFLKAYLGAWKKYSENTENPRPQYLVIEEINRGNCAQIFGDLFQLLDRSDNGFSTYPIEADTDLQKIISQKFNEERGAYKLAQKLDIDDAVENYTSNYEDSSLSKDIMEGRVLLLPKNLYIWATMNTSDQSLFPIDSAFKRRWDWEYIPIDKGYDKNGMELKWYINIDGEKYDWWDFIVKVNNEIFEATHSEDKQLGFFFCKAINNEINAEKFVSKVIFYLWNDVFKDFDDNKVFGSLKFRDFYLTQGKDVKINTETVKLFLQGLKVETITANDE